MDEEPEYAGSVYEPEEVARAILRCAEQPTRDVTVGGAGKMITMMGTLAPRFTDVVMERTLYSAQKKQQPAHSSDSLHRAGEDGHRHGNTERSVRRSSTYTRATLSNVGRVLPVIAVGALVAASVRAMRKAG